MKVFGLVLRILALVAAVALFALSLGTIAQGTPFFGSISSYIVLGGYRYFIPAVCALFVVIIVLVIVKHKLLNIVSAVFLAATIVLSCVCLSSAVLTFREAGADVNVAASYNAKTDKNIVVDTQTYTTSAYGDVTLDVYSIINDEKTKPVIVYIHGGGWISGSKQDHTYYARKYAEAGYVAVNVDYDLSDADRHLSDTTERQLTAAFAWIKTHIAEYGGNSEKVYLTGDSAGGNLALELAYKINDDVYVNYEGTKLPKITAVAVTYPVADPAMFWGNDDLVLGNAAQKMCEQYTGTTPEENPALYDGIKPSNFIGVFAPPTLVIVGKADTMVQPEQSYALCQALDEHSVENKLVALPYLNHGFDSMDGDALSQGVLSLTLQWFENHP